MISATVWEPRGNRKEKETYLKTTDNNNKTQFFNKVKVSEFSMSSEFMKYKPHYYLEEKIHKNLTNLIENQKLKDFYAPIIDPTLNEEGNISYEEDKKVATNFSYNWWVAQAENFYPEKNSRLGKNEEFVLFIGSLIEFLVDSNWDVSEAWRAICYDSENFVKYSKNVVSSGAGYSFCGYYDLVNTFKVLHGYPQMNSNMIFLGSGCTPNTPIADIGKIIISPKKAISRATGWIIFDA